MQTPAERHARALIQRLGYSEAVAATYRKLDDSLFLVNGDRNFWIAVREALGAPVRVSPA